MVRSATIKRKTPTRKSVTGGPIRTYRAALKFLNGCLNFERTPPTTETLANYSLNRMQRLVSALGHPQKKLKCVHVAGSKGKGSTVAMLAGMLRNCGYKVGVYTSPHILDARERITVNGTCITEAAFTRYIQTISTAADKPRVSDPTYFEALTAAAFLYFVDSEVEIALIETGLGGRLDATNVVSPEVVAITSISNDHMGILGNTLEEIALEKAGIFKKGIQVNCSPQTEGVEKSLREAAEAAGCPIRLTGRDVGFSSRFEYSRGLGPHTRICVTTPTSKYEHVHAPMLGDHQALNCALALGVIDSLKQRGFAIDDRKAVEGLSGVKLAGRMEFISEQPRIMVDGAHNAASIEALMRAIGQNVPYDSMVIIFGCQKGKDITGMLRHIRLGADKIIFTSTGSPRSMDPFDLSSSFNDLSTKMCQVADTLEDALSIADRAVTRDDLICITGSFALVGRAKRLLAK